MAKQSNKQKHNVFVVALKKAFGQNLISDRPKCTIIAPAQMNNNLFIREHMKNIILFSLEMAIHRTPPETLILLKSRSEKSH